MIRIGYFHDAENKAYNAVCLDPPHYSASSGPRMGRGNGSKSEAIRLLLEEINHEPGDKVTADELDIQEIAPWRGVYGQAADDDVTVIVVGQTDHRGNPVEREG